MPCIDATDIVTALGDFYTLEQIDEWLDLPHPQLGGRSASALIVEGRNAEVMAVIERLRDGVYL